MDYTDKLVIEQLMKKVLNELNDEYDKVMDDRDIEMIEMDVKVLEIVNLINTNEDED
jgi:hypothetical protein